MNSKSKTRVAGSLTLALLLSASYVSAFDCSSTCTGGSDEYVDVLIVGAGMSGIAAANFINNYNLEKNSDVSFKVVEAQDRVGGRMKSDIFQDYRVELGANWIQGGQKNPALALAWEYHLDFDIQYFRDWTWTTFAKNRRGKYKRQKQNTVRKLQNELEAAYRCLNDEANLYYELYLSGQTAVDNGAREVLKQCDWNPQSDLEKSVDWYGVPYEFADDASEVSIASFPDDTYRDFNRLNYLVFDQEQGFEGIADNYANDFDRDANLELSTDVHCIDYSEDTSNGSSTYHAKVYATNDQGQCKVYHAKKVISTVSVGVLTEKRETLFNPVIDQDKVENPFYMALYYKVFVQFETKFWDDDAEFINIATDPPGNCGFWQNLDLPYFLEGSRILFCTLTTENIGDNMVFDDAKIQEFIDPLKESYGVNGNYENYFVYEWKDDPYTFGSYENFKVGATLADHDYFKEPVQNANGENVVHIAGSAACFRYWGFVHGAYEGGERAAKYVLSELGELVDTSSICDSLE